MIRFLWRCHRLLHFAPAGLFKQLLNMEVEGKRGKVKRRAATRSSLFYLLPALSAFLCDFILYALFRLHVYAHSRLYFCLLVLPDPFISAWPGGRPKRLIIQHRQLYRFPCALTGETRIFMVVVIRAATLLLNF
jgi:hypothetical protein